MDATENKFHAAFARYAKQASTGGDSTSWMGAAVHGTLSPNTAPRTKPLSLRRQPTADAIPTVKQAAAGAEWGSMKTMGTGLAPAAGMPKPSTGDFGGTAPLLQHSWNQSNSSPTDFAPATMQHQWGQPAAPKSFSLNDLGLHGGLMGPTSQTTNPNLPYKIPLQQSPQPSSGTLPYHIPTQQAAGMMQSVITGKPMPPPPSGALSAAPVKAGADQAVRLGVVKMAMCGLPALPIEQRVKLAHILADLIVTKLDGAA